MKLRIKNSDGIVDVIANARVSTNMPLTGNMPVLDPLRVAGCSNVRGHQYVYRFRVSFCYSLLQSAISNPPYMFAPKPQSQRQMWLGRSRQHCCALQAAMILARVGHTIGKKEDPEKPSSCKILVLIQRSQAQTSWKGTCEFGLILIKDPSRKPSTISSIGFEALRSRKHFQKPCSVLNHPWLY